MKGNKKTWIAIAIIVSIVLIGIFLYKKNRKKYEEVAQQIQELATKNPSLPRGIRNNNPGNIRISNNDWKGKVPKDLNTDKKFEQFTELKYGVRAMTVLMRNWIKKGTANTIEKVVNRFAPPTENNSLNYVQLVSQWTGIPKDQILDIDKETMKKLVLAMARKENGGGHIKESHFEEAWQLV